MAETKKDAVAALEAFVETYQVKYERAADCLTKDRDALLPFYDFPAEHWKHLRTTDEIDKPLRRDLLSCGGTGDRAAKSRDRGCKPGRAAFSVAPRLRHPCAGLSCRAAAIGSRTARRLVRRGGRARSPGRAAP